MNTVVECVDKLNDTCQSHERCSVVEVMGRHAGHIALNTGIATGAVQIITEEIPTPIDDVVENVKKIRESGMDNAQPVLKEKSDFVTLSNDQDGVAEAVKHFWKELA